MKVMVFVKATPNSEKGLPPAEVMQAMFEKMGAFNEKLSKAGIMKDGDGLKPSKFGKRIAFKADHDRSALPIVASGDAAEHAARVDRGARLREVEIGGRAAKRSADPPPGKEVRRHRRGRLLEQRRRPAIDHVGTEDGTRDRGAGHQHGSERQCLVRSCTQNRLPSRLEARSVTASARHALDQALTVPG